MVLEPNLNFVVIRVSVFIVHFLSFYLKETVKTQPDVVNFEVHFHLSIPDKMDNKREKKRNKKREDIFT